MASKKVPAKARKTIGLNMPKAKALELERRAKSMQLSCSAYCQEILDMWVASGKTLTLKES